MNDFHRLDSVDNQDNFTFISKLFPQKKSGVCVGTAMVICH